MTKKIYIGIASCFAFILTLTVVEPTGAAVIDDRQQGHRHAAGRRRRATRTKAGRQRAVIHVCPMHPDIRSKSPGTCPKCLMKLEPKVAQRAQRK